MTGPKLPRDLCRTGASVAIRLPIEAGATAHRAADAKRPGSRTYRGEPVLETVPVLACDQDGPKAALLTAAWADHIGAGACALCFPNAS